MRTLLFLVSLSIYLASTYELVRRYQAEHFLVLETSAIEKADSLLAQKRWQEAKYLASYLSTRPDLANTAHAHSIELAADTALDYLPLQTQSFLEGMISGEANNTASLLGAVSLDLFVVGDVRDIIVQGYKELTEQNGDKIILALSATGLSLSLLPEFHWVPSIMKGMKRSGALSKPFLETLGKAANTALESGNFKPLGKLVSHFGRVVEKLGIGPGRGAMRAVHSEADLAKLARAASLNPKQSYAISTLTGQRGLKMLDFSGKNVASIAQKIKHTSRLAKIAKKSFGALPTQLIVVLLLLSSAFMFIFRPFRAAR